MSTEANIIRLAIDTADPYRAPVNKINGSKIQIPRGKDSILQIAVYEKGIFTQTPSFLATVTAEIRPTSRVGAAIVTNNTSSIATISEGQWLDDTSQHLSITLPAAQTAGFSIGSTNELEEWLVITALTTGGKPLTLAAGLCTAIEDGGNYSAVVPTPGDPTFVTAAQFYSVIDALNKNEITENGYRGRLGIDANGKLVLHLIS
jgi:hypothetical protein